MTTMKLSEGLEPGEGLEMRKASSKLPASWSGYRKEGGRAGASHAGLLLILHQWGEKHPCSKPTLGQAGLVF